MTAIIIIIGILIWVNASSNRYKRRNHFYSNSEYSHYQRPPFYSPYDHTRIDPFGQERFRPSEKEHEHQALFYTAIFIFFLIVFLMSSR